MQCSAVSRADALAVVCVCAWCDRVARDDDDSKLEERNTGSYSPTRTIGSHGDIAAAAKMGKQALLSMLK